MIGAYGNVGFVVSRKRVRTFHELTRELSSRWAKHDVHGRKPITEYIGPELMKASLKIALKASLGVNPREEAKKLERICEEGGYSTLVIGGAPYGTFIIKGIKEEFEQIGSSGEILAISVTVDFEEYVPIKPRTFNMKTPVQVQVEQTQNEVKKKTGTTKKQVK